MEYHQTGDILHVKKVLGHRSIQNTMKYIHLIESSEDRFVTRVAVTTKDIVDLVDKGFEYVCEHNNAKILRKRK